jgi:hypothetical protein
MCGTSLSFFPLGSPLCNCVLHSSEGKAAMSTTRLLADVSVDLVHSDQRSHNIGRTSALTWALDVEHSGYNCDTPGTFSPYFYSSSVLTSLWALSSSLLLSKISSGI